MAKDNGNRFDKLAKSFADIVGEGDREAGAKMRHAALMCEGAIGSIQAAKAKQESDVHEGLYAFAVSGLTITCALLDLAASILDPPENAGEEW